MLPKDTIDHIGTSSPPNPTAASILGLLSEGPKSGWDIHAAFEASIGQFWSVTRSQIYRELRALETGRLITIGEAGARERRICAITPLGRRVFEDWIARMPGDELIRFPLLLMVFFGDSVPPQALRRACAAHRKTHADRLAGYEQLLPLARAHQPFPALTLAFGIAFERAVVEWIDALPWMTGEDRR